VDPFAEVGVVADEDVAVDVTPHVESAVAVGLDIAAEADPLARDDGPTADAQLDDALAADEYVTVGDQVVFLDVGSVGHGEFVQWVRTKHGVYLRVTAIKTSLASDGRQTFVK
jgi:hypothetical protein